MKKNTIITAANKTIDTKAKAAGLNYFQRRKLKKGIKNFGYDVGVETASRLAVDAVEGAAYLAGRGVVKAGTLTGKAIGAGVKAVKTGATAGLSKAKGLKKGKAKTPETVTA